MDPGERRRVAVGAMILSADDQDGVLAEMLTTLTRDELVEVVGEITGLAVRIWASGAASTTAVHDALVTYAEQLATR
jgi:hypothetical protein